MKKYNELKNNELKKEILFIKHDLEKVSKDPNRYKLVIDAYKKKLVELGAMKEVKDKSSTKEGKLKKKKDKTEVKAKETKKVSKTQKETNAKKEDKKDKVEENKEVEVAPKKRGRPRKNV